MRIRPRFPRKNLVGAYSESILTFRLEYKKEHDRIRCVGLRMVSIEKSKKRLIRSDPDEVFNKSMTHELRVSPGSFE